MKNSPVLNISANAVVKNLGNVSKPVLQANPGESTGSFDHTFAQHMEKVAQTHRQEKPATFDAPKPHSPTDAHNTKSTEKSSAKPTTQRVPTSNDQARTDQQTEVNPTGSAEANPPKTAIPAKHKPEPESATSENIGGKETEVENNELANLPVNISPDLSILAAGLLPQPPNNITSNLSSSNLVLEDKITTTDAMMSNTPNPVHADVSENTDKFVVPDNSANMADVRIGELSTAADSKAFSLDKPAKPDSQQDNQPLNGESNSSPRQKQALPAFDPAQEGVSPGALPGKIENIAAQLAAPVINQNVIMASSGKDGWDKAISQKIVWMVGAAEQTASLTLNPPDLGPLQVVIHVHNDQTDATFSSDNKEVRQALEDGMSNLRDMMKEAGITLGQTNIGQRENRQQEFAFNSTVNNYATRGNTTEQQPTVNTNAIVRSGLGLVDTFA